MSMMGSEKEGNGALMVERALKWSELQGHILSGGGTAEALYTEARGYPFSSDELPHHHLINGTTSTAFQAWSVQASAAKSATAEWMAGVWHRTIFAGGGMQTTDADEFLRLSGKKGKTATPPPMSCKRLAAAAISSAEVPTTIRWWLSCATVEATAQGPS